MRNFNEANTIEAYIRDLLCGGVTKYTASGPGLARAAGKMLGLGWHYISPGDLPRQSHEVMVESHLVEALVRLNPEIAAQPDRVDEVIYKLWLPKKSLFKMDLMMLSLDVQRDLIPDM